ncbi:inositol polyphosphate 5-phosphatase K-like, partial [Brachionus plicatilis]
IGVMEIRNRQSFHQARHSDQLSAFESDGSQQPSHQKLNSICLTHLKYVQSTRLVGILLNIYIRKNLLPHLICCSKDWIRLGLFGIWGNKGANICTFKIGGTNICFVNTHLSAHEHQDKERLIEYSKIMYHSIELEENTQFVIDQNYLFFFGDLNFRVENLDIFYVKDLIDRGEFKFIMENDQLQKSISKEKCFSLFKEDAINFPPTYKFKLNSDDYDLSKKNRVPSYCDRVLYKIPKDDFFCSPLIYNHIPSFKQSDHRPVFASFEIRTLDFQNDEHAVKFLKIAANSDQDLEINYQIKNSCNTHILDWIGVYDASFKSTEDYVTYVWAPRIEELEESKLNCHEKGYFSYNNNCLIGMSSII